jgi:hypothetical protein
VEVKVINLARDFGRYPVGRYLSDGPYSGELFREKYLLPALKKAGLKLVLELDGARGYGSSFLEEAFGGLVRAGIQATELLDRIEFRSSDKSLVEEIHGYVEDARVAERQ